MKTKKRTRFYAKATGLSKAEVREYRTTPVNDWTTTADREIGSSIRALERLAREPEISWADWRDAAASVLKTIRDFVNCVFERVTDFVDAMVSAFERVIEAIRGLLRDATDFLAEFQPLAFLLAD